MSLPDTIETERLILRPFRITDAAAVLGYANNENFVRYLPPVPYPYTEKDAAEFIARRILEDNALSKTWAITLKPIDQPIGGFSLRYKNKDNSLGEFGWSIAEEHWGKGLTTEGAQALVNTVFSNLPDMHKLYARADLLNVGSWRVMEKIGMQREALLRQHEKYNGAWQDDVWYGILRPEWENAQSK